MEKPLTFTRVARPTEDTERKAFVEAFLNTLETGDAISVPLEGIAYRTLNTRLQSIARTHKVKQRSTRQGDHVIVWAEKLETKEEETK